MNEQRPASGFTLVEVMIVVSILGILFSLAVPYFQPNAAARLQATAEVVAADIAFARSMAVSRGSTYMLTFDQANNRYGLTHTGDVSAFDGLPASPFHYDDNPDERTTDLNDLPGLGQAARLSAIYKQPTSGPPVKVATVEFQPLGNTTRSETTFVWLRIGQGAARRFLPIRIEAATGLETVGEITLALPVQVSSMQAQSL